MLADASNAFSAETFTGATVLRTHIQFLAEMPFNTHASRMNVGLIVKSRTLVMDETTAALLLTDIQDDWMLHEIIRGIPEPDGRTDSVSTTGSSLWKRTFDVKSKRKFADLNDTLVFAYTSSPATPISQVYIDFAILFAMP